MADLQLTASRFHCVVAEPQIETTPAEIAQAASNFMVRANMALDLIGNRKPAEATFSNTLQVLDQVVWEGSLVGGRFRLLFNAGTNLAVRKAAGESLKVMGESSIDADYRLDVAAAIKAVADAKPQLTGEDERLLLFYVRELRWLGLDLPAERRQKVAELHKKLASAEREFVRNLQTPPPRLNFTRAELAGIPARFLRQKRTNFAKDKYLIEADTYQIANARPEETRKRLWLASVNRAAAQNTPLLQHMLEYRNLIARELGYFSWADYVAAGRSLTGTAAAARAFCEDLNSRLEPKFETDIGELTRLKAKETRNPNAKIEWWDVGYYVNQSSKKQAGPSLSRLCPYCPTDRILHGSFDVWERIFGLRIEQVDPTYRWAEGVQLYSVSDSKSGEPLGLIYLDPYAREGKSGEVCTLALVPGKQLADGNRQCPVAVVEMQLPQIRRGQRFGLSHNSVQTIFHEFGHALHEVLSRSKYATFAGNQVAVDYVEVPSELLQQWPWDKQVLDAVTRRNGWLWRKIPPALFERINAARIEYAGTYYRSRMAWALADLALNTRVKEGVDCIELSNQVLGETYLPLPPGTAPATSFNSLVGYDAAVYSHVWCEAIAADMLTAFQSAPGGLLDPEVGMRLRREIFETGGTRSPKASIEKFLGRPYSTNAFFRQLGLERPGPGSH